MNLKLSQLFLTFFLCISVLTSCGGDDDVKPVIHVNQQTYTSEEQNTIGVNLSELINKDDEYFSILDRNEYNNVYEYLVGHLNMLVITSGVENRNKFDWDVHVIQDDNILSAFTTPGGKIYLYTGLLKFLKTENELSCLLGHEMKYADDGSMMQTLKTEYNGALLGDCMLGYDTEDVRKMARGLRDISFSKENVKSADEYSIELHCPFNFDVMGIKTMIERAENLSIDFHWLETRPSSENRVQNIIDNVGDCGGEMVGVSGYTNVINMLP